MPDFDFTALRRFPDVEADNLFAYDASDHLILDEAADDLHAAAPGEVVVIGDRYGALTLGALALHDAADIRTHQDSYTGELALQNNAAATGVTGFRSLDLGEELLTGSRVVLMQMPKSLSELDEVAETIARFADPSVTVFAGGRLKHMSIAMNEVLGRHFGDVRASLGRQKSRVIRARDPRPSAESAWPQRAYLDELGLWVVAHGAAFAGPKLDLGTRELLRHLDEMNPDARTAVDLGCGTGLLATALARTRPELAVLATDTSAAAVASTRATAEANEVAITVRRDDGLSQQPDACADLVLLNPPFHTGSTVHAGVALRLFEEAARVLKPGGELWTVYNSHLTYRPALYRIVGGTRQVSRTPKFTVTVSTAR
ncbi:16S rRNA (guanine1207-N2)-methyltransferase [Diaminobutyricimonas aerilata]|uniref:16S rRNA (Guanine1207-N2)-methyltransferase n=1 Tax=Diaminobutyricimonas aerilata TaxID=1162967 RepID=A0A2M9CM26_9MICO|nr:class I SAM-dependent methyltransferase [Diaminobutyricimonas aerilata]PJJ72955.1 16S rRNA (guanine1207-N2)-methyltransferase [Diaminobutyricimonas aerilata]